MRVLGHSACRRRVWREALAAAARPRRLLFGQRLAILNEVGQAVGGNVAEGLRLELSQLLVAAEQPELALNAVSKAADGCIVHERGDAKEFLAGLLPDRVRVVADADGVEVEVVVEAIRRGELDTRQVFEERLGTVKRAVVQQVPDEIHEGLVSRLRTSW